MLRCLMCFSYRRVSEATDALPYESVAMKSDDDLWIISADDDNFYDLLKDAIIQGLSWTHF